MGQREAGSIAVCIHGNRRRGAVSGYAKKPPIHGAFSRWQPKRTGTPQIGVRNYIGSWEPLLAWMTAASFSYGSVGSKGRSDYSESKRLHMSDAGHGCGTRRGVLGRLAKKPDACPLINLVFAHSHHPAAVQYHMVGVVKFIGVIVGTLENRAVHGSHGGVMPSSPDLDPVASPKDPLHRPSRSTRRRPYIFWWKKLIEVPSGEATGPSHREGGSSWSRLDYGFLGVVQERRHYFGAYIMTPRLGGSAGKPHTGAGPRSGPAGIDQPRLPEA